MNLVIGLDVGGTKIAGCVFDTVREEVVESVRVPTGASRGGEAVADECADVVRSLVEASSEVSPSVPVGIAVCELVAPDGRVTSAASFDWRCVDLAARFEPHPFLVESDVRAAALAEARLGAGAGRSSFVYLTVGTGIAFSLVLDGEPYRGARGNALILGAPPVERVASGLVLTNGDDEPTPDALRTAADHLGRAMAWLVNALDPEVVVTGGGLGLRADYISAATAVMRAHVEAEGSRSIPVVPAALGSEAGAIGAALYAASVAAP